MSKKGLAILLNNDKNNDVITQIDVNTKLNIKTQLEISELYYHNLNKVKKYPFLRFLNKIITLCLPSSSFILMISKKLLLVTIYARFHRFFNTVVLTCLYIIIKLYNCLHRKIF